MAVDGCNRSMKRNLKATSYDATVDGKKASGS
jgi:hypothetical protein